MYVITIKDRNNMNECKSKKHFQFNINIKIIKHKN